VLACEPADLAEAWQWLARRDLHKLSLVDATSFVLLARTRFDTSSASTRTLRRPASGSSFEAMASREARRMEGQAI